MPNFARDALRDTRTSSTRVFGQEAPVYVNLFHTSGNGNELRRLKDHEKASDIEHCAAHAVMTGAAARPGSLEGKVGDYQPAFIGYLAGLAESHRTLAHNVWKGVEGYRNRQPGNGDHDDHGRDGVMTPTEIANHKANRRSRGRENVDRLGRDLEDQSAEVARLQQELDAAREVGNVARANQAQQAIDDLLGALGGIFNNVRHRAEHDGPDGPDRPDGPDENDGYVGDDDVLQIGGSRTNAHMVALNTLKDLANYGKYLPRAQVGATVHFDKADGSKGKTTVDHVDFLVIF